MESKQPHNSHHLTKSDDKILVGVCGGIAKFLGWKPGITRFMWCLVTFLTGVVPGVVAYILLAFVMPRSERKRFNLNDFRVQ